jgi:phage terminase large subunit-like protein
MQLMKDPLAVVTHGTTYENMANLSPVYRVLVRKYEGTRTGRQELNAELLDDIPGALWTYSMLDRTRLTRLPDGVLLVRCVVGLDPSASEEGAECGIVAAAVGSDGRYYVLADGTLRGRPEAWADAAIALWAAFDCDRIVAEVNNGGDMIEAVIRSRRRDVPMRQVHASRGKITRAEPISLLYERGLVSHVGSFPELEDQMCTYDPMMIGGKVVSPDRMDALVWALTDLSQRDVVTLDDDNVQFTMNTLMSTRQEMNL